MVASIEDLPRLNDEERDARDDHAAIAGVPSNDPTEKRSRNRHPWRSAFFARWRLRRLQRSIARAEQYLAARQDANEKYGVYDQPVRDAEQELARLQKEVASPPRYRRAHQRRDKAAAKGRPILTCVVVASEFADEKIDLGDAVRVALKLVRESLKKLDQLTLV